MNKKIIDIIGNFKQPLVLDQVLILATLLGHEGYHRFKRQEGLSGAYSQEDLKLARADFLKQEGLTEQAYQLLRQVFLESGEYVHLPSAWVTSSDNAVEIHKLERPHTYSIIRLLENKLTDQFNMLDAAFDKIAIRYFRERKIDINNVTWNQLKLIEHGLSSRSNRFLFKAVNSIYWITMLDYYHLPYLKSKEADDTFKELLAEGSTQEKYDAFEQILKQKNN